MRSPERETQSNEPRSSVADKPAKGTIEMAMEQEVASSETHERTWPKQKPARPDAIDIARTFAVIIVGSLVGAVAVIVVFMLLN